MNEDLEQLDKKIERERRKKNRSAEQKMKDKQRNIKYNMSEKGKKRTSKAHEK